MVGGWASRAVSASELCLLSNEFLLLRAWFDAVRMAPGCKERDVIQQATAQKRACEPAERPSRRARVCLHGKHR